MAITKVEHVGVFVKDMETSIAFYRDVLGLVVKGEVVREGNPVVLVFLGFPDSEDRIIELVSGTGEALPRAGIVHHIAFTVSDLSGEIARLRKLPVRFHHSEPQRLPDGSQYIFFDGPDGENLELFEPARKG